MRADTLRSPLALLLLLAALPACTSMVPPLRTGVSTLPEPAGREGGAVQVGGGYTSYVGHLEPRLIIGVARRLDLDLDLMAWPPYQVVMGSVGLRWYPLQHRYWRLGLAAGVGIGTGGWYSVDDPAAEDGVKTEFDRSVNGGAFVGLDLGIRLHRAIGLYLGQRFHAMRSGHVDGTYWGGHVFGIHLDLLPRWYLTLETGLFWYVTPASGRILSDWSWGSTWIHATTGVRFGKVPPQVSPFARRPRTEPAPTAAPRADLIPETAPHRPLTPRPSPPRTEPPRKKRSPRPDVVPSAPTRDASGG